MKTTFIILEVLMINLTVNAQTFEETQQWITNNVNSSTWYFSHQVSYDYNSEKLLLIKVLINPRLSAIVREINPANVTSVSISKAESNDGLKSIRLNFKYGGTKVKSYFVDDKFEIIEGVPIQETNMHGLDIYAECDLDKLKKIKKAYIHLFNELGIKVKDGDYF
ncbi:MAG: hypothetical protein JJE55_13205 [Flavobacteriaceae bacterium]|nr:hypothetical protein [Flavobacteriaceae bacterium]